MRGFVNSNLIQAHGRVEQYDSYPEPGPYHRMGFSLPMILPGSGHTKFQKSNAVFQHAIQDTSASEKDFPRVPLVVLSSGSTYNSGTCGNILMDAA
jgi:hypothetical protein